MTLVEDMEMKDNSVHRKLWYKYNLFYFVINPLNHSFYLDEDECVKRETGLGIFDKHPQTQQRAEESSY